MSSKNSDIYIIDHKLDIDSLKNIDKNKIDSDNDQNHQETDYTLEDALNIIGVGKLQIILLFVCGIIIMAVFNETMGMMIIVPSAQCDLKLGPKEKGFLGAIGFIGILISSHAWGYLADTIGRKKVIMYTLFGSNIFAVLSCFINNYWAFVMIRLLAGICISGPSATIYAYLGEFNTLKFRTAAISLASAFVGVSTAYIPAVAWLILPQTWSITIFNGLDFRPWRVLLLLYTLPGFIGALCLIKLPESPKFMLSQGHDEQALKILHWIYKINWGELSAKTFPIRKLVKEVDKEYLENLALKKNWLDVVKSTWRQTVPLYKKPYLVNFTICCVIQFGLFFISSGMGLWYPEILNRVNSASNHVHQTVCDVVKLSTNQTEESTNNVTFKVCNDSLNQGVFLDSIILGLSYIVAYVLLAAVINRIDRKIILPSALFGSGLSGVALHWVTEPIGVVVLFCCFIMLAGTCVAIMNGAVVDLIPTHLRGMALCLSLMIGRSGGIVGSNIIGSLLEISCDATFFLFAGFIMFCGLLSLLLPK